MMKRRKILLGLAFALALGSPLHAQDLVDSIIDQLRDQGFKSVVTEETMLGRVRIVAKSEKGEREIIVNPNTGEILRDLWTPLPGSTGSVKIVDKVTDDDDDDDDDDGDDDDDDNSGSGSSGSGN